MRLISVDIANFRVIRSAHLDFPDQLIGIIGPNGSGKSTLIEAISWALYGHQVARSGKEEIKSSFARPSEPCEVSLAFEVHGEHYRVVRRLAGKSEKSEVELYRGAASESGGVSETRSYVGTLLGLDWRGFLTSFLARQSELNALSNLAPAKRREHLAGMLGIERLDKAIQRVKEDTRLDEERSGLISQQLAARDTVEARVVELREHVKRLKIDSKRQAGAYEKTSQELSLALAVLREHQEREAVCSRLQAEIEANERSRELLAEQELRLRAELQDLGRAGTEIAQLDQQVTRLEPLRTELEQLRGAQRQANLRADAERQVQVLSAEVQSTTDRLAVIGAQLERIGQRMTDIPDSVPEDLARCQAELQQARDQQIRLSAQRQEQAREEGKLVRQMADIGRFGPGTVCDHCHRPFRADELEAFKTHLAQELGRVRGQLAELDREAGELKESGQEIRKSCERLERLLDSRKELAGEQRVLETEQKELRERLVKCDDQMKFLEGQLAEIGDIRFDQELLERLQAEHGRLEAAQARLNQLRGSLGRLGTAEVELRETAGKLAGIAVEIGRLQGRLAEVGFDAAKLQDAQDAFDRAQEAAASAYEENLRVSHELDLAQQELAIKAHQLKDYDQAARELEATRTRQFYGESLARLFADFRKRLIARIRPRLAELTGQLLDEMSAGRYPLVELDEDYNMLIYDYGQFYGVERFSGGEADLANLCLRLAISLSLTESAGLERSFVILDEVFGSQDEARRDLIFQGLANLKGRFPQIMLITHFEELKHKVETLFEVVPTGSGWSEVRVNGAPA